MSQHTHDHDHAGHDHAGHGHGHGHADDLPVVDLAAASSSASSVAIEDVTEAMKDVVDPELGINVVDLGLVYDIWIEGKSKAVINMTLTSPACPLTDMLFDQTETLVLDHPQITEMQLNWVWSPPWGPHMITEDGREQMRALGFSV